MGLCMSDLKDAAHPPPMTAKKRAQIEKEIEDERKEQIIIHEWFRELERMRKREEDSTVQKEAEEFRKILRIVDEQSKVPGCPLSREELLRLHLKRNTALAAAATSAAAVPKERRRGDPDDDPIGFMGRAVAGGVALGTTAMVLGALRND